MKRLLTILLSVIAAGTMATTIATAAGDYPTRDIKHIMPWGAGGGTDTVMRSFINNLENSIGASIYTVNIAGAKSGQGISALMKSKPDGYTIGSLTYDSIITVPYFGLIPEYSMDKLDFICTVTEHPTVIAVSSKAPWDTLEELVADARKNPGSIAVSNVGLGGVWHLPAVDFEMKADISLNHIPFPGGSAEQREALLKNEVPVACISIGAIFPALKSGHAKLLGIMSEKPLEEYPDVPTFKEKGYDVVWGSMRIVAVPAGTPAQIREKLEAACGKTAQDKKWKEWLAESGGGGWIWMNAEETNRLVSSMQKKVFSMLDSLVEQGVVEK